MITSARARTAVIAAVAAGASGCSFVFAEGPPAGHANLPYFDCSQSHAPPVIDSVIGLLSLVGAFGDRRKDQTEAEHRAATRFDAVVAAATLVSAVYGYWYVSDCNKAKGELFGRTQRARAHWMPPPGWPPTWPPPTPPLPVAPSAAPGAPADADARGDAGSSGDAGAPGEDRPR